MSRRWYRHGSQVVFLGWEPSEKGFYVNVVDLCGECSGAGEEAGSDELCPACGGEGVQLASLRPSNRQARLSLEQLGTQLSRQGLPFPDFVRADLEQDLLNNAGAVLKEYEL